MAELLESPSPYQGQVSRAASGDMQLEWNGPKRGIPSNPCLSDPKETLFSQGHLMCLLCPQVYSSMERLSLLEERRTPPPTKRSLSEEKEDHSDGLAGLKGRDRSWVIGSPEM